VEALDGCVLDRAVHLLDQAIRPRMVRLGQLVLDPVGFADHVEAHWPRVDGVQVARLLGELDVIVGQDGVDLIGHSFEHELQELPVFLSAVAAELSDDELGCPVDANEQEELPFSGPNFRDVDMKEPDGIALELLALGLVAFDIWQARDAIRLQKPMKRRPRMMRDRRRKCIEAVV
jgi:hypothetical protein